MTAIGRLFEFSSVPDSCRSPRSQFPPMTALWQHVVRVLPANSGRSRTILKVDVLVLYLGLVKAGNAPDLKDNQMTPVEHQEFLRESFDEYLQLLAGPLEPNDPYLPYDFSYIVAAKWRFMADTMLQDELREVINRLHEWHSMLRRWHAWNKVVSTREGGRGWNLRLEFMEPLMYKSLLMPSAFRDLFTFVGTNALHQVRLHVEPGYKDVLKGDPTSSDPTPRPLTRRQKEARLTGLAAPLSGASAFVDLVRELDDNGFRVKTKDYRNANSHAIGPRIALGQTRMVTRHVVPATRMETMADGTCRVVEVPGRYVASYVFGGMEPLDLETARFASLDQYHIARTCFDALTAVLMLHANTLERADA
jgi:hypothetical protein